MIASTTQVLDHRQVSDRVRRIAWQIYENHHAMSELVLAGIAQRGYALAELLVKELRAIAPELSLELVRLKINKKDPLRGPVVIDPELDVSGKAVILIDDVLNSGSTLIYGVKHFLDFRTHSLQTVVLVDRSHKRFPVKADYKGISLSTGLMEHVTVQIEKEPYSVRVQ